MQNRGSGAATSSYDVVVVGGGIAGLTAAAYLSRSGQTTLLCEKEGSLGGLVRTFERRGFFYDAGIRSLENCGVVMPMLRDLGLEMEFLSSPVSVGIEDRVTRIQSSASLDAYQAMFNELFPANTEEIAAIISEIRRVMGYMDVLYGIDNPLFMDLTRDPAYLLKVILPWLIKYMLTVPRIAALGAPVLDHLRRFTRDQSLIDIIAQHFFRGTPAFFALSYFSLYLDYHYPRGGTGVLPESLASFARAHGATLATGTEVVALDPDRHTIADAKGHTYTYRRLIWAADTNALYRSIDVESAASERVRRAVRERRAAIAGKGGGDSVYTLYLALDLDPSAISDRASAHHFYTPSRRGQSEAGPLPLSESREEILAWLDRFLRLTTYEISCPVLRDSAMAPAGQTGLIVSILFDYALTKQIEEDGWYEEFKAQMDTTILDVLDRSAFPGIKAAVVDQFSSTPLTIARTTGNTDGAITGWAFTNGAVPAEHRMMAIARSVRTPIPDVFQAGQWTYSPSGVPISIITGKLAADAASKRLRSVG
ncbi:MAG: phytoene desaturase family protein [Anaerolineae bacterium]